MKGIKVTSVALAVMLFFPSAVSAQFKKAVEATPKTEAEILLESATAAEKPVVITLDQALQIALSDCAINGVRCC